MGRVFDVEPGIGSWGPCRVRVAVVAYGYRGELSLRPLTKLGRLAVSGIRELAVPGGADMSTAEVPPGRQPLSRPLQAVLILVRLLFAVTVVGALDALLLAAS